MKGITVNTSNTLTGLWRDALNTMSTHIHTDDGYPSELDGPCYGYVHPNPQTAWADEPEDEEEREYRDGLWIWVSTSPEGAKALLTAYEASRKADVKSLSGAEGLLGDIILCFALASHHGFPPEYQERLEEAGEFLVDWFSRISPAAAQTIKNEYGLKYKDKVRTQVWSAGGGCLGGEFLFNTPSKVSPKSPVDFVRVYDRT